MAEQQRWMERQALSTALAICGAVATLFTMAISWWVRDLAIEVKKVPVLEQRVVELQDRKKVAEEIISKLQETISRQTTSQAVLEQRLASIDQQLRLISARLSNGRVDGYP